ncbi:unnamed protein product [Lactuca virosa]|uniref:ATP-dependent DNA helicase n=1 Tax=Lactuca virosa TaxID=75947 RepID=A0AAU9NME5_9ASTR|nr:unnamed protein product [Lactuca virosa]
MHSDYKLPTVEFIDPIIYAEIPNIHEDPELYSLVNEFMIHGPCGAENINCPCMVDKKCSKNFPKQFCNHSSVDQNGFPLYRRRNDGHFVEKSGVKLDNRNVVPYNKYLLKRYQSHINVEWCNQGSSIKYPSVVRLPFHLPGQQQIIYGEDDDIDDVLDKHSVASSMFTAWMECNAVNADARKLTYVEFPTKFVWHRGDRIWKPRKVKGPKSFEEIRTVNGEEYSSFRDACYALGLLDDDKEYIDAIKEASHSGSGSYLQFLFATLLMCNSMSKPEVVWKNTWEYLADGILYHQRQRFKSPEQVLLRNNLSLKNFKNMPIPDVDYVSSSNNRLITEELNYDITNMKNKFDRMFLALTNEQRHIFEDIMTVVKQNKGGVFFVCGYGGTGKTFLWKTVSAAIRKDGHIVLNVASSEIASLLLPGGRTAHSRFIIPFELTEDSICKINRSSDLASLLRKTSLIIWDEAPMVHKHAFEALDRSLKDVFLFENSTNSDIPFGGKVIVFGGDFRQILLVIPGEVDKTLLMLL